MLHDTGAYLPWGIIVPFIAATTLPGPYVMPAYKIEMHGRADQPGADHGGARRRPAAGGVRDGAADGPRRARAQASTAPKCARRNIIQPEQMPYSPGLIFRDGKPMVYASGDFPKSQRPRGRGFEIRRLPRAAGQGARAKAAISASASAITSKARASARSRASPSASCRTARSRSRPAPPTQGQGTRTTLSQIVADHLGCRIEDIVMSAGDTGTISQGIGAFASRQAINAGSSAHDRRRRTCEKQVIAAASRALGVPESDIDVEDGRAIGARRQQAEPDVRRAGAAWRRACRASRSRRARRRASSTPPISRRRRRPIATARTSSRSRSIR